LHGQTADGQNEQKDTIGMTELKIFGLEMPKMDWTKRRRMQKLYGFEAKSSSSSEGGEEEDEEEEGKMHLGWPTNGYELAEFDRIEEDLERKRLNAGKVKAERNKKLIIFIIFKGPKAHIGNGNPTSIGGAACVPRAGDQFAGKKDIGHGGRQTQGGGTVANHAEPNNGTVLSSQSNRLAYGQKINR
jgi:hypothetical protein